MVGQAKLKRLALKKMVQSEPRCIYCTNLPSTIEHMPPLTFFRERLRPKGMEFAACVECNEGTRGADLVASFFSRMDLKGDHLLKAEAIRSKAMLEMRAPGVLDELFDPRSRERVMVRRNGIIMPMVKISPNGPRFRAYLTVFAAKFGMALYREHVGEALPSQGAVQTNYYLNAGLTQKVADEILSILPTYGSLKQGKFTVPEQFGYRYNTDKVRIVAALASFHTNLHVLVIATSEPETFKLPLFPGSEVVYPGRLIERLPGM